jgi:hypothetical protein
MEKLLVFALVITTVFSIFKILEMKYLEKDMKPLKFVIRDAVIVFVSSFATLTVNSMFGGNVQDFMNVLTDTKTLDAASTQVFTGEPGF